jgi:hypothetical protein
LELLSAQAQVWPLAVKEVDRHLPVEAILVLVDRLVAVPTELLPQGSESVHGDSSSDPTSPALT